MVLPPKEEHLPFGVQSNLISLQRRLMDVVPLFISYKPEAESFPLQCPRGR
ncbi:MAG: hypothetical protein H6Q53_1711 [Deltaproteobacteria bacterium]|nr:hypothetical protein [Deltaproteobacteria bacterium]